MSGVFFRPRLRFVNLCLSCWLNRAAGLPSWNKRKQKGKPHATQEICGRALLLRADLAIVPCKASMLEVRALAKATEVLRVSQDIRGGLPRAVIVLSMVGKNYRLTADMKDAAAALNLPLASGALTLRQIYADAPGQGSVVWNMGTRARVAAEEVDQIFRDILPEAVATPAGRISTTE
jgi:chromosome partitioning protein